MKRYNLEVHGTDIRVRVIRVKPFETVLNIEYGQDNEHEIIIPSRLFKKQFTDNSFTKHILGFFIKE